MISCALVLAYIDPGSTLPMLSGLFGALGFLLMVGMVPFRLAARGFVRIGREVRRLTGVVARGLLAFGRGFSGVARRLDL